eukprot:CAMPEP_0116903252 /NCGR_PEP_ID=MMETSP0467-20121206/10615_1 /TAXON_ID=283647 /ORGANISM="Mesodinium pulex, Strain SPMC105" /LENGTH=124 /DNA_ID=CAMNT_0004577475 /DNA_START=338 /DNA_END=712 /DNA_ORIENTATION=+
MSMLVCDTSNYTEVDTEMQTSIEHKKLILSKEYIANNNSTKDSKDRRISRVDPTTSRHILPIAETNNSLTDYGQNPKNPMKIMNEGESNTGKSDVKTLNRLDQIASNNENENENEILKVKNLND